MYLSDAVRDRIKFYNKDVNDFINNIRDTLSECIENIDETIDNAKILENYNF